MTGILVRFPARACRRNVVIQPPVNHIAAQCEIGKIGGQIMGSTAHGHQHIGPVRVFSLIGQPYRLVAGEPVLGRSMRQERIRIIGPQMFVHLLDQRLVGKPDDDTPPAGKGLAQNAGQNLIQR